MRCSYLGVVRRMFGRLRPGLLGLLDPLLLLLQLLLGRLPVLLPLVLRQLLGIRLHLEAEKRSHHVPAIHSVRASKLYSYLLQPLVSLFVKIYLAGSGQVLGGGSEVTQQPGGVSVFTQLQLTI